MRDGTPEETAEQGTIVTPSSLPDIAYGHIGGTLFYSGEQPSNRVSVHD